MIETVKVSQQAKDQLLTLKRRTRITQWNTLCRWALLRSLSEPSPPVAGEIVTDSNVEMSWRVFAGPYQELISGLLRQRCLDDGLNLEEDVVAEQFRSHLHRGIGYLVGDQSVQDIVGLVSLSTSGRAGGRKSLVG